MALSGWRPCEWNRCLTRLGVTGFYFNSSSCLILRIVGGKQEIAEFYNKSEAVSLKLGPSSLALIQYALNTHSQCHVLWLRNIDRERPFFLGYLPLIVSLSDVQNISRVRSGFAHGKEATLLTAQLRRSLRPGQRRDVTIQELLHFFFFSFKLPPGVATQ